MTKGRVASHVTTTTIIVNATQKAKRHSEFNCGMGSQWHIQEANYCSLLLAVAAHGIHGHFKLEIY